MKNLFKKLNYGYFLTTLLLIILFSSCNSDEMEQTNQPENHEEENQIELIEKLENPYSVKNMRLALQNLTGVSTKSSLTPSVKASIVNGVNNIADANNDINDIITTTHHYLKFKPKNEEELDLIKKDTTLFWFDYPLDYEISDGDTYHDPEVPEGQPTYQYTYATVNHELPAGVEYEIIEDLFIPEEEDENDEDIADNYLSFEEQIAIQQKMAKVKQSVTLNTTQNISLLEALEQEALSLTDNNDKTNSNGEKITGWFSGSSKWYPSGYIKVSDTELGTIPIEGVKIRFGRWFKWKSDITDSKGYYRSSNSFRRKVRYKMDWERHHFALRDGGFSSAQHRGSYKKGSWNWTITSGEHQYYATIFRAAHHYYYYEDIQGLRRPKKNTFWNSQLRIGAFTQNSDSYGVHQSGSHFAGLVTGIKIYSYGRDSDDIYATTIHELAHSSHYEMSHYNFRHTDTKIKESWARGVQWALTRMVYPNHLGRERSTGEYTLVVADMIDDDSTDRTNFGYGRNSWETQDNVSDYTIKQIEDALLYGRNWNSWRNNLINQNTNPTQENLSILFEAYE